MSKLLKRQISDAEKEIILKRFGRKCYATGHDIPENEELQFDHIKAYSEKGVSDVSNIAPMCKHHNKQKGRYSLEDFRIKILLDEFFDVGNALTLKDELEFFKKKSKIEDFGQNVYYSIEDNDIQIEIKNRKYTYPIYDCPITSWKYFYASVPVEAINSDDDEDGEVGLQPRYLIDKKVFNLYRHFQYHPVLQPSIARLVKNKILVFDGQHKIASLLWSGRKLFDLKIYLDPDPQLLNKTNISAHDKFAQTRFYAGIMVAKLGSQFGKQFEDYKNQEDNKEKTEGGFLDYLRVEEKLSQAEVNKKFKSFLFDSVLNDSANKIARLVSKSNRRNDETPLTIDMLSKSILSNFIYQKPTNVDLASNKYYRNTEIQNAIELCNIINDELLGNWNKGEVAIDNTQTKLKRIFSSKSMMAWSEIFRDAVAAKLELYDADEKEIILYRNLTEKDFDNIRRIFRRLGQWPQWNLAPDSEIDRILSDRKSAVKNYLRNNGLTTGFLMGAPE